MEMIWKGDIEDLVPLVDFLGGYFGSEVEFTLHDLSKPGKTIIAISNGYVTGRKVGDTLSDFTLETLKNRIKTVEDFIEFKNNTMFRAHLKSADLIIRNENNDTVGLLCVNLRKELLHSIKYYAESLLGEQDSEMPAQKNNEFLFDEDSSFVDVAVSIIDSVLAETNVPVRRMTSDEKIKIVAILQSRGIFQLKGIISIVASKLETSEATIYRYLNA